MGHRQWMDSSCIDAYFMNYWFDNRAQAHVVYLPTKYLASLRGNGLDPEEVQSLLEFIAMAEEESPSQNQPYAMVIHDNSHFFNAVFDYKRKCVNIYGRYISMEGSLCGWMDYDPENEDGPWMEGDAWNGLTIYKNLKVALFGNGPEDEVACQTVNWIQVHLKLCALCND